MIDKPFARWWLQRVAPFKEVPQEKLAGTILEMIQDFAETGPTEDEIVETSFAHLREKHPDMADHYGGGHDW